MTKTIRAAILGIALFGASCAAGTAGAQVAFFGVSPFGPVPQTFGNPHLFSVFGNPLGISVIGVNGVQTGYATPDGGFYPAAAVPSSPVPPALYYGTDNGQAETAAAATALGGAVVPSTAPKSGGRAAIARTANSIDARIDNHNRLVVRWMGDPAAVNDIGVELLDTHRHPIKAANIDRLPAETSLAITSKTAYYRVTVDYTNGSTTSSISPL